MAQRVKGVIIRMLPNRGYCFIRDGEGISRMALAKHFQPAIAFDTAREGLSVEFLPTSDPAGKGNGMRAEAVRICSN